MVLVSLQSTRKKKQTEMLKREHFQIAVFIGRVSKTTFDQTKNLTRKSKKFNWKFSVHECCWIAILLNAFVQSTVNGDFNLVHNNLLIEFHEWQPTHISTEASESEKPSITPFTLMWKHAIAWTSNSLIDSECAFNWKLWWEQSKIE